MKSPFVLWVSAGLIFFAGYWFGTVQSEHNGDIVNNEVLVEIEQKSEQLLTENTHTTSNQQTTKEIEIQIKAKDENLSLLDDKNNQQDQDLAELGEAFQQSKLSRQLTELKEVEFEQGYSANHTNLTAQNQISDFLSLHQDAKLIDLYRLDCDNSRCQMIGEYAGEHQDWAKVISGMRGSDWWDYVGTSSSTTSKDGKTYFHIFLDK
ncbi:hypothetical protein [Alteromonas sp. M12]|uniref:hypothetical protein n=1 Tax=Alteromonas sp. M12 TaxID=3135644 RepID=UPI00319E1E7D